jgi:hypothetical protein
MALIKEKQTGYGVAGNYWRILQTSFDVSGFSTSCLIALYKDHDSRESGCYPLDSSSFVFGGELNRSGCYEMLKQLDQFADAVDG